MSPTFHTEEHRILWPDGVQVQTPHDYAYEREQQKVTQSALLERLRYKGYVTRGSIGWRIIGRTRDLYQSKAARRFILALVYFYLLRHFRML